MSKKGGRNTLQGEMSFKDLRCKDVVNQADGRKLGRVCDLIFSPHDGCVLGIVAPYNSKGLFFRGEQVFIPLKNIIKIGPDVILVKLSADLCRMDGCVDMHTEEKKDDKKDDKCKYHDHHHHHHQDKHDNKEKSCDKRCEKCMLFECESRWCF